MLVLQLFHMFVEQYFLKIEYLLSLQYIDIY